MDSTALLPLLEQLDDNLDDLEEVLTPVMGNSLAFLSKKLPVMDKAKILVLVTYTLESLIFSYVRLHGEDAKQHPVFRELTRVKQYFEKIKALETEPEQRPMTLDKAAAGRFIKHGLAGNDKIDLERAEKEAKERARAQFKAAMIAKKQAAAQQNSPATTEDLSSAARTSAKANGDSEEDDDDDEMEDDDSANQLHLEKEKAKKTQAKDEGAKSNKAAKKQRKNERSDKKERRKKKEASRKARSIQ
ncbi:hypothetical protein N7492_007737 [Penicillium capsulatum]|uniref:Exosome complex protein n=1 Tax=Penicillium capsulatum TaxID=69766 RepID=A0A9W9I4K6_9EURO|nr:hypothetical protein N7492_007737 [Penicillium capsulatum]KAJ6117569.1 hypothetical protein N7512_007294 [Penicillium capsulatum]